MRLLKVCVIVSLLVAGCSSSAVKVADLPEIVQMDYKNEEVFFERHKVSVDIHLENIGNSEKANTVRKLVYENMDFDDYAKHREEEFVLDNSDNGDFRGREYMDRDEEPDYVYSYELGLNYSVRYHSDSFAIIKHTGWEYRAGAAHGQHWENCFIIDLAEERILGIDDLFCQIPNGTLREIIEAQNEIYGFLTDDFWPPDSVGFEDGQIGLLWNTYSITPYVNGTIHISPNHDVLQQYLTDTGKRLYGDIRNAN
jgi:hypothetical protein